MEHRGSLFNALLGDGRPFLSVTGTTHALLRLEAPAQRLGGLDAETFRGFQLAGELFLLTSFFIEPEGGEFS
jgi:hypothetical protein